VERLGDLWWLLAHDERGHPRVGPRHFATGLAAAVLGEVLMQCSGRVLDSGDLVADAAVTLVLGELTGAAREGLVRPVRVWVEWLADHESDGLLQAVTARMVAAGLLVRQGRQVGPVDAFTAFAPITALVSAVGAGYPVADPIRLLGGLAMACGLAGVTATNGEDMVRPLQLLAMHLPKSLYSLVIATDDAIHALATRRR
jgi:hypothetical protein